jgi:hypothetical protein
VVKVTGGAHRQQLVARPVEVSGRRFIEDFVKLVEFLRNFIFLKIFRKDFYKFYYGIFMVKHA